MPILSLADTGKIAAAERDRLIEADDAIRDIAATVETAAARDGRDGPLLSRALVGIMLAAAARQALAAYPSMAKSDLSEAFAQLAAEAFGWASRRSGTMKPRNGR
jgi:hypothetical protein